METTATVQCPWCFETMEIWIDPETRGKLVRDCEVCCRPWDVVVMRDRSGNLDVVVSRSN